MYNGTGPWQDASGNGHDAVLTTVPGHPVVFDTTTRTFRFDGAALATVSVDIGPSVYPQLTIEAWFNLDPSVNLTTTNGWLVGHDNYGYDRAIVLADSRFGGVGSGVGFSYNAQLGYPGRGTWHQVNITTIHCHTPFV